MASSRRFRSGAIGGSFRSEAGVGALERLTTGDLMSRELGEQNRCNGAQESLGKNLHYNFTWR
jgi:hypothetical protein